MYSVRSYHIPVDEETLAAIVRCLRKWCGPDHKPIFTMIGVASLASKDMRVEIEVEALLD